jgi:hypothetical protein
VPRTTARASADSGASHSTYSSSRSPQSSTRREGPHVGCQSTTQRNPSRGDMQ